MTRKNLFLSFIAVLMSFSVFAQNDTAADPMAQYNSTPKDMWEFGVGLGHAFAPGDVDFKPGFGGSIHLRKAIDYIFSIRGEVDFLRLSGGFNNVRADGYKGYSSNILAGEAQLVVSLNSLLWRGKTKKYNLYAFAGVGGSQTTATIEGAANRDKTDKRFNEDAQNTAHLSGGVGIGYRINSKFNIGLEHKTMVQFGKWSDYVDGYDPQNAGTTYRDIPQITQIKLNFNLGNAEQKTEPLYWINPMSFIQDDIAELKARPKFDLTDTDGDGVIDMLDQEKDTPSGAIVNTKGMALDSDGDSYPDYKDKEPYSAPGYKVDGNGVAQMPKDPKLTEGDVARIVDDKLKNYQPKGAAVAASLSDWFLPMIHFDLDKYGVNRSEFEKLHYVATVLKNNPGVRVAVTGFTDRSASDRYNNVLSYNRAKAAIDHLTSVYGISRDRLVLTYNGETNNLVPSNGNNYMNRRVEFKVASGESDQERPAGPKAGKAGFSGGKNSGY